MDDALLLGLYTAEGMRSMDAAAIEKVGIPAGHLMERAGVAVAREVMDRFEPRTAAIYAGKGNNGGDGFVVARELACAGVSVVVVAVAGCEGYQGSARLNLRICEKLSIEILDGLPPETDVPPLLSRPDVVVDAVFGTGFSGAARGPAAAAIERINATPAPVVAIDIASGVHASSGAVAGPYVDAEVTVTMQVAKVGHFVTPGGAIAGEVVVVPIGIPPSCNTRPDVWVLTPPAMLALLRPKNALDHKRSVGRVLVVGGAPGMGGAAFLAGMGALRAGGGLVRCAVPAAEAVAKPYVETIAIPLPDRGGLGPASKALVLEHMRDMQATALGPGLGRAPETVALVRELVTEPRPLVIDADGLWALDADLDLLRGREAPTILTPHEGELGRLLSRPASEIGAHRLASARQAAKASGATVVLKGEATIIADPGGHAYVVPTGNPGLATPGTGDVLTGALAAQLAKGLGATEAACLGAYLHGLAADLAAEYETGTDGMVAGDLLGFLPRAIERLKHGEDDHGMRSDAGAASGDRDTPSEREGAHHVAHR